jgi:isopentenyl diphosphate isomerase/L-lactate dehydrogenase-like FMN-dependent dehydrogenase
LDTFTLGWRPHDLETAYIPFGHGVGCQIGFSDPVFMAKYPPPPDAEAGKIVSFFSLPVIMNLLVGADTKIPEFPYEPTTFDRKYAEGDAAAKRAASLGVAFIGETTSGLHKSWDDLAFLRKNWDGPIILKGIQSVHVSSPSHCVLSPVFDPKAQRL